MERGEKEHLEFQIKELEKQNKILIQLNKQQREEFNKKIKDRDIIIHQLIEQLKKQQKAMEKLQSQINKLDNSNKPPSKKADWEKPKPKPTSKKSGRKKGHKGVSRKTPKTIHRKVHYKPEECEHCGSKNLRTYKTRTKIITEILWQIENIKEIYHDRICKDCGKQTKPKSIHGDSKSPFGKNLQKLASYLKITGGMTYRPIENLFKDFFKIKKTDTTLINTNTRHAKKSYPKYLEYLEKIKTYMFSHKDETGWRIMGKLFYIWVYDCLDVVFYRIGTREKKIIEQDFKNCKNQISVNDDYKAYYFFEYIQLCWAHILRKIKFEKEKEDCPEEIEFFYGRLCGIYICAKDFAQDKHCKFSRIEMRQDLENEICELVLSTYSKSKFLNTFMNSLIRNLKKLFLFVEIEGLPSNNNQAERSLRPLVVHKKISFGSKSISGAENLVVMKTIWENVKRQGGNLFEALDFIFNPQQDVVITTQT